MGVKLGLGSLPNHYLDNTHGEGGGAGGVKSSTSGGGMMELLSSPLRTVLVILAAIILLALAGNIGALNGVGLLNHGRQSMESSSSLSLAAINSTIASILDDKLSAILAQHREQARPSQDDATSSMGDDDEMDSERVDDTTLDDSQYELRKRQRRVNYSAVWMSDIEIDVVLRHLGRVDTYLEWGSGGSTLNFARFARQRAHSIEHDQNWCTSMADAISDDAELSRVVSYHCIPVARGTLGWGKTSPFEEGTYSQFRSYIDYIDHLNESTFDFILDDGRARVPAAIKSLSYITKDSVLVLHDAERLPKFRSRSYYDVLKYYEPIDSVGGINRQGVVILKRKSSLHHLEGDHAAVQRILDDEYSGLRRRRRR